MIVIIYYTIDSNKSNCITLPGIFRPLLYGCLHCYLIDHCLSHSLITSLNVSNVVPCQRHTHNAQL